MTPETQHSRDTWMLLKSRFEATLTAPEGVERKAEVLILSQEEDVQRLYTRIKFQKWRNPSWPYSRYSRLRMVIVEGSRNLGIVQVAISLEPARKRELMARLLKESPV